MKKLQLFATLLFLLSYSCNTSNKTTSHHESKIAGYTLIKDWWKVPQDSTLGQLSAVAVDNDQNVLVFRRSGRKWMKVFQDSLISLNTVTVYDGKSGKALNSWGANRFIMPHGITVDQDNHVWITDVGLQQVFKFSHDGRLLMTLGEARKAGDDATHFNLPTDVAVAKDGSFYVSDGYGNSRVIKFSKEGKFLFQWGTKGNGQGEFNLPHAVGLDTKGNVYVADRENNRIQKFDAYGKFLKLWQNTSGKNLYSLAVSKGDKIFAVDFASENKIVKGADVIELDTALNVISRFGRSGRYDGPLAVYHDLALDKVENIYTVNIYNNTIQKFKKN